MQDWQGRSGKAQSFTQKAKRRKGILGVVAARFVAESSNECMLYQGLSTGSQAFARLDPGAQMLYKRPDEQRPNKNINSTTHELKSELPKSSLVAL